jgi:hypothetical protein
MGKLMDDKENKLNKQKHWEKMSGEGERDRKKRKRINADFSKRNKETRR